MRETLACIEVGEALGYVEGNATLRASIDHVMGTLYKLTA